MGGRLAGAGRVAGALAQHVKTAAYLLGWRLVRLMPERRALALFDLIAGRVYRANGRSVRRLRANLARVRPELDDAALEELTRTAVGSYLRYWCESFRLPSWPTDDLVRRTRVVNEQVFREALAAGHGVVIPLPHMANWDWAGAWACATGAPLITVAERLRPERLYDEFVAFRSSLGMTILPLTGGGATGSAGTFERLVEWAQAGGLVCLVADRDLSRSGVEVSLCDRPARLPGGPAVLARRTGAALIPATLAYDGPDMVVTFHEPVPCDDGPDGVRAMMQGVADAFSAGMRAHPQDWHMMQKVFTEDLDPARLTGG